MAQAQARVTQAEPVQQNIGQSQQQVDQLQGQAEQAQAQLDNAELNLEFTVVRAAQDGWVTRRNVDTGNYVTSGTQIMSLVTPDVWVTANSSSPATSNRSRRDRARSSRPSRPRTPPAIS